MWPAGLLTWGAASFGRVLLVGLLPNGMLAIAIWALVRAGSFSGESHWDKVVSSALKADAASILLFVVGVALVAAVLQPFQVRMIRLLEGHWYGWAVAARFAPPLVERQRRRVQALRERVYALPKLVDDKVRRRTAGSPGRMSWSNPSRRSAARHRWETIWDARLGPRRLSGAKGEDGPRPYPERGSSPRRRRGWGCGTRTTGALSR